MEDQPTEHLADVIQIKDAGREVIQGEVVCLGRMTVRELVSLRLQLDAKQVALKRDTEVVDAHMLLRDLESGWAALSDGPDGPEGAA